MAPMLSDSVRVLIGAAVEKAMKQKLGATARVTVLPPKSLPVTEGKTKRVIRTY